MSATGRPGAPGTAGASDGADEARQRARALSFGQDAAGYDEARPSYPAALVDDLLAGQAAPSVLDVGCGTGKAGRLLVARGARVLGVEADERMAAIARSHGIEVEVARFEDWEDAGRRFALVTAAQSWHWVDRRLGPAKAADVLDDGGLLALFWNLRERPAAGVAAAFDELYARLAPELAGSPMVIGAPPEARGLESHLDAIADSGRFEAGEARHYRWRCTYDATSWSALLATQSDHRLLDEGRRARLLEAAAQVVEDLGGSFEIDYTTLTLLARRRT